MSPFEVRPVTDRVIRDKIREVSWNQAQVTDSAHFLVFAAGDDITQRVNMMFDPT